MRQLALVVHFHQPIANLDSVVRTATDRCYRPFLETLAQFPELPMTLHYSGCLLEWLESNEPDVTDTLKSLVDRGQVELMTGGMDEPILAALPHRDRVGQIQMLNQHLGANYGASPTGLWLTERVWEPDVVAALIEAGARYTVVDDTAFHAVGIDDEQLTGPFVTDHEDAPLLVYAGSRTLRYLIPYKKIASVIEHLGTDDRLFVYADDGEKFGEWPDTYERVHANGWLRDFFTELLQQRDRLEIVTLGDHAATAKPVGRVYLPSSSYDEMMTWALPNEARLRLGRVRRQLEREDSRELAFLKGAPWRAFLAKYPEVNHLQKRMIQVSRRVHDAGDPPDALRELYKAQCNCSYWHGAFGGAYLDFMRAGLWHHLMRAEAIAQANLPSPALVETDFDADLDEEVFLNAAWGCTVVSPARGGTIIELDNWQIGANLVAVIARHQEAYHLEDENPSPAAGEAAAEAGEAATEAGEAAAEMAALQPRAAVDSSELQFDERPRAALVDFIDGEAITGRYDHETDAQGLVRMSRKHGPLQIAKQVAADAEELITVLSVTNLSDARWNGRYSSEGSFLLLALGRAVERDEVTTAERGWKLSHPEAELWLEVDASVPIDEISSEPIDAATATLEGLQTMRQGTAITTSWDLDLGAGEAFSVELRWRMLPNPAAADKKEKGLGA